MSTTTISTQCCIAGGGPAGMMLGYLLARRGVDVVVLEKHADFFRDFRGDTIHPSTMQVMHELGLLDEFLRVHHQELPELFMIFGDERVRMVDFSHLPVEARYIALMPQWDFLSFIEQQAGKYPGFHLYKKAEAVGLLRDGDKVTGLNVKTDTGMMEVRAQLTVGADGRSSTLRGLAGMDVIDTGVPIDVLWLRIPKDPAIHERTLGYLRGNNMMVLIDREDYFQCGYIIPKGGYPEIQGRGIESFRQDILHLAPFLQPHISAVAGWDDISLLTVQINHLVRWYQDGLLCIGDAAHAMSPAGGVGINLAIQDAVAAANILAPAFLNNTLTTATLRAVQRRREWPARIIQMGQAFIHNHFLRVGRQVDFSHSRGAKAFVWILRHFPFLQRIPARIVGMGFRPEHISD